MQIIIADVHIRPHSQEDHERFLGWLEHIRPQAEKIYIIGDLFTYWFSGIEDLVVDVAQALNDPQITIMSGNRDFLLQKSAAFPGVYPSEELITNVGGRKLLLTHGHRLTQGDYGFKVLSRLGWPLLKKLDQRLSSELKHRLAEFLVRSSNAIRPMHGEIPYDTAEKRGVDTVICGHLHRGVLTDRLIIVPAFLDSEVWLALEETGPHFHTRRSVIP